MPKARAILVVLAVLALSIAGVSCRATAQEVSRTVLSTLAADEEPEVPEVECRTADGDTVLMTKQGKGPNVRFFVYKGGKRHGPFTSYNEAKTFGCDAGANVGGSDNAVYEPGPPPEGAQFTGGAAGAIAFKGTTFGPHQIVFSQTITPDGAIAYVTAADNDKAWLESSDGRKVSFRGTPGEVKVSPDGKSAVVQVEGRMSLDEMNNLSKLTPEKITKALEDNQKKTLFTIDGQVYGPFDELDNVWFARTSNALYYRAGGQIYRNGEVVKGAESASPNDFYPTADGKAWAVAGYEKLTFSDGKEYAAPLALAVRLEKGRTIFRWLALEKGGKELVAYERGM